MPFRDGSLSTFPDSVDQFLYKNPGDRELSSHFNHYFDAALNLENYLLGSLGGSLESLYSEEHSGTIIENENLLLSYVTVTGSLSGAITTVNFDLTVPARFGSTPFDDWRFSIGHSVYLNIGSTVKGLWANRDWGQNGSLNQMINLPQLFTSFKPTGGRNYRATVNLIKFGTGGADPNTFYDSFERGGTSEQQSPGADWVEEENGRGFTVKTRNHSTGGQGNQSWCLWVSPERGGNPGGGWIYPSNFPVSNDMEVEYDIYDWGFTGVDSGEYYSLAGPMVRMSGTVTNASFYGVIMGHGTAAGHAQLVKVSGVNLMENYPTTYAESQRPRPDSTNPNTLAGTAGTVTVLASGFTVQKSAGHATTAKYRLRAEGTTISFTENFNGGGWTSLASVTDSTLTSGKMGLWVKSLNGATDRIYALRNVYCRILDQTALLSVRLNILYALIGETGNIVTV